MSNSIDEQARRWRLGKELHHAEALPFEQLEAIMFDGDAETADGCIVEPDGVCEHGYRSPLRVLGMI